jgi:hypothetical protein
MTSFCIGFRGACGALVGSISTEWILASGMVEDARRLPAFGLGRSSCFSSLVSVSYSNALTSLKIKTARIVPAIGPTQYIQW